MSTKDKTTSPRAPQEQEMPQDRALGERIEAEIGAQSQELFDHIRDHWRIIAGFIILFLVLAGGYGGYTAYQERQLAKGEQAIDQVLLESQGAQRLSSLMALEGQLAKPLLPRHHLETAKAAHEAQDWSTALEYWKKLAAVGPDAWKPMARLGQSAVLMHLGQVDQALAELESLRAVAPEELVPLVLQQMAETAEAAENWDQALAAYEELKTRGNTQQAGFLDFKIAQIRKRMAAQNS